MDKIVLRADLPPEERKCRNKQQYTTRKAAKSVAKKQRGVGLHVYRCDYCSLWHLTRSANDDFFNNKIVSKNWADKLRRGEE